MQNTTHSPLIVQVDRTILLEVHSPLYELARDALVRFAELQKSPEHIHTYVISPLSLWNAAASGMGAEEILGVLDRYSKYPVPAHIRTEVYDYIGRYGKVKLVRDGPQLILTCDDTYVLREIWRDECVGRFLGDWVSDSKIAVKSFYRGHVKQALIRIGFPVQDLAGYSEGDPLALALRGARLAGSPFALRRYQQEAADIFYAGGSAHGGCGVIVLPCGAGKTIVGMACMVKLQTETLVLTTSVIASRQWKAELLDKTTLSEDQVGEYNGEVKQTRPVTISTYQMLTYRNRDDDEYAHFMLFSRLNWGLIVYDEVHLLPAPVFRITAELQAKRRLGLTATLVREDGKEDDVFSLVGPKRYDVPWKVLEEQGWIAAAKCTEVRMALPQELKLPYSVAQKRSKFRLAAENPIKMDVAKALVDLHSQDLVLVIGHYISQVTEFAKVLDAPLITGATPNNRRDELYRAFRQRDINVLVVSKVGNFAIDLPDANVLVQLSGTFGSRQEEAQRLGRILRPKADGSLAIFYSLVTRETREQEFAEKRQRFLTEQGYSYEIQDWPMSDSDAAPVRHEVPLRVACQGHEGK